MLQTIRPYGMTLVVGPTGSGKTTTLHSSIAKINLKDSYVSKTETGNLLGGIVRWL